MGAFEDEQRIMEWYQAKGKFHVLLFLYDGIFSLNGLLTPFRHGALFVVPPGSRCRVEASGKGPFTHGFFSFYPPDSGKDVFLIPIFTQFDRHECDTWEGVLRHALKILPQSRMCTFSVSWNLLWRIAQPLSVIDANPLIEVSMRYVEERLREKISIRDMAAAADVSHNHLIRHFRLDLGVTPIQYVRQRRAEVARAMLTNTARPIKAIAHDVGVPNLHAFNRLIRECLGMSPRQVRRARMELDYYRSEREK